MIVNPRRSRLMELAKNLKKSAVAGSVMLAGMLCASMPMAAQAQGRISPTSHSEVRLIAADAPKGAAAVGVRIKLSPGWKTYWRTPGDSGVPPSFDWSQSKNLASAEVRWPAPTRFTDRNEMIFGYKDEVIFPVVVTPIQAGEPVKLVLSLFFAVCHDMCVPVHAQVTAELSGPSDPIDAGEIARFESMVPRPTVSGLAVRSIELDDQADEPSITVVLDSSDANGDIDIFTESPVGDVNFGAPRLAAIDGGVRSYKIPIDKGYKKLALSGTNLSLTIVQGKRALVHNAKLD